jgi:hypothetical protein
VNFTKHKIEHNRGEAGRREERQTMSLHDALFLNPLLVETLAFSQPNPLKILREI